MRLTITAFIAGEALLFFLPSLPSNWFVLASIFSFICLVLGLLKPLSKAVSRIACIFFAAILGFAWSANFSEARLNNILDSALEGKELVIEGRVAALPQGNQMGAKFAFQVDRMISSNENLNHFPNLIYLSWQPAWRNPQEIPEIFPGQRWKLKVKLKCPYGTLNPYAFDFERWAFHQNYGASGSVRSGNLLDAKAIGLMDFKLRMELARWSLRKKIRSLLPGDARYAGVMIALVMGDQNAIEQDDWRTFNATGIGHLISISGLHVTMLAGIGASLAAFVWRRRSFPLLAPVIKVAAACGFFTAFIYAWLAGFQIPAQRTMYMVGVVAFALWTGRNPRSFDIWWWALLVVLVIDPMSPYTPGFWLSFGAVAAILFSMGSSDGLLGIPTGKELEMHWVSRMGAALREACRVQLIVTIALLPVTLFWFYQVSIVSPFANALAIPLVSYVVTPLAIAGALLPEFIGRYLLVTAHHFMEYLGHLLEWMASWSWSVVYLRQPEWWTLAISGIGIVYAIKPGPLFQNWHKRALSLCLSIPLFISFEGLFANSPKSGEFRATVFDIGQGTAVLIETATKKLLYDTGPIQGKSDDAGSRILLPYFRGTGISHLDRLVISHSDSDHVGGGASLLKLIKFSSMLGTLPADNPLLINLKTRRVPSIPCRFGQHWTWDGVEFFIWHPNEKTLFEREYPAKPNEMSCVLEVRNQQASFWLTGDVERQGEGEIVNRLKQSALDEIGTRELIFMAPHHGSKTSSSEELLKQLSPNQAFAQNGYQNRYGHPHPVVTARYESLQIPFFQTPHTGAQIWDFGSLVGPSSKFWRFHGSRLWHRVAVEPKKQKALKN